MDVDPRLVEQLARHVERFSPEYAMNTTGMSDEQSTRSHALIHAEANVLKARAVEMIRTMK